MIYVIAAHFAEPSRNAKAVDGWLRSNFESWTCPMPGVWIVEGALAADQIYTALSETLSPDDRLVIVKGGSEAMWHGVTDSSARWLTDYFPGSLSERIPGKTEGLREPT